jgi:spore maturation protein CgeB
MKVLYIGQYKQGSTTRMRGEYLEQLLQPALYTVVDMSVPIANTPRIFRSFGWRYNKGPLIYNINNYIRAAVPELENFDLVWIDKGVFLGPSLIAFLKNKHNRVVHYTPDTAFSYNRSSLFFDSLPYYDYCVTTKSFELDAYRAAGATGLIYCTQGYDPAIHKSYHGFAEKKGIVFVGLSETYREEAIARLVEKNIPVLLSGEGWDKFVHSYRAKKSLVFAGPGLFHEAYGKAISGSLIGLGLLSKKFPEQHTTRTFEIPACCTALATESNAETRSFYNEGEAIFFNDLQEMSDKIEYYIHHTHELESLTIKGFQKVQNGKFDYKNLLSGVLSKMDIHANPGVSF